MRPMQQRRRPWHNTLMETNLAEVDAPKLFRWALTKKKDGKVVDSGFYSVNFGHPVTAEHVLKAPSIVRWSDGLEVEVTPP